MNGNEKDPAALDGVGHVMIGVSDAKRSTQFYRDKLGLTVLHEMGSLVFLDGGSVTIGLSEELGKSQEQLAGAVEIVFRVGSVQSASERLRQRGVALVGDPKQVTPNEWVANLRDPDGHLISVFGPR